MIDYKKFTIEWLQRAKRQDVCVDDVDRFIALWVAFNGWMRQCFGEDKGDRCLINKVKESEKATKLRDTFKNLRDNNGAFAKLLAVVGKYEVINMQHPETVKKYDGSFESLIEVIYQVRCNLIHGGKNPADDKKDFDLVSQSYKILLPLFEGLNQPSSNPSD